MFYASKHGFGTTPLIILVSLFAAAAILYLVFQSKASPTNLATLPSVSVLPKENISALPESKNYSKNITNCLNATFKSIEDQTVPKLSLVNRSIRPSENTEAAIKCLKNLKSGQFYYTFIQFRGPITEDDKKTVMQKGILLLESVPEYIFIAKFTDESVYGNNIYKLLRWIGPVEPEDKISKNLLGDFQEEKIEVNIRLYENMSSKEFEKLVQKYQGNLSIKLSKDYDEYYRIQIPPRYIKDLAGDNRIAFIEKYSPPVLL